MNWKKEYERIGLDFMDVTWDSMTAYYQIGNIGFEVNIEWWKDVYDHESRKHSIDIKIKDGRWHIDMVPGYHEMEFGYGYKEWMLSLLEFCMDEFEFLSEYTWNTEDEFNYWSDYGI